MPHVKKLIGSLALAAMVALALGGCSSPSVSSSSNDGDQQPAAKEEPTEPSPQDNPTVKESHRDLVITNSGYSALGPNNTGYGSPSSVYYGFAISFKNPNETYEVKNPVVHIVGKDKAGNVTYTDDQTVPFILPGDEYTYTGKTGNGTSMSSIEFSVSATDQDYALYGDQNSKSADIFSITDASNNTTGSNSPTFTGKVTMNTEIEGIHKALICVSLKDKSRSDQFAGGYSTVVDIPEVGVAVPFTVDAPGMPQSNWFDITAIPWE